MKKSQGSISQSTRSKTNIKKKNKIPLTTSSSTSTTLDKIIEKNYDLSVNHPVIDNDIFLNDPNVNNLTLDESNNELYDTNHFLNNVNFETLLSNKEYTYYLCFFILFSYVCIYVCLICFKNGLYVCLICLKWL